MNCSFKSTILSVLVFLTVSLMVSCDETAEKKSVCGDLFVTGEEKCDHGNLNHKTCQLLGFGAGTLDCAENCLEFDTSGCGASFTCGDNVKNGSDVCDGNDLGSESCTTEGFDGGTLKCMANCSGYDTTECGKSLKCGNGDIDSGEVCDGSDLNGRTCVDEGFEEGDLACSEDCKTFDKTDCYTPCTKECGDRVCGPDPVCGESCGECSGDFVSCNSGGQCEKTCDLDPFIENRAVDINLETVTVSGELTLNGATPASNSKESYQSESRGSVGFINKKSGSSTYISIGSSGKAAFSIKLFKGSYDIVFNPNSSSYQNVFPSLNMNLESDVLLEDDAQKNYNLDTVLVSGKVTIDGAAMANNSKESYENESRGSILFTNKESGSTLSVAFTSNGEASYNVNIFKGTYTFSLAPNNSSYQNSIPPVNMILEKDVDVSKVLIKNFNLETAKISGKITLNGAQMAGNTKESYENESRGSITFSNTESGGGFSVSLGSTGVAAFNTTVFKGSYNVLLTPNSSSYQNAMPSINMILENGLAISGTLIKNFNLDTAMISGKVTIDGAAMANNSKESYENENRGSIYIKNKVSGGTVAVGLGNSGEAAFNTTVFKGQYDFSLVPNNSSYQNAIPAMDVKLESNVDVNATVIKNFNLDTAMISGKATLNGATMPNNSQSSYENESRGSIGFKNKDSGSIDYVSIGSAGEAVFNIKLFKGVYDVILYPNGASYQNVLPANQQVLDNNISVEKTLIKNFDVETVTINGSVKLNGAVMPNNSKESYENETRGSVAFRNKGTSDPVYISIGSSGVAAFSAKLFKGSYDVEFLPNSASYQNALPDLNIKVFKGCYDYSADCNLDIENISGSWEFIPSGSYWTPIDFNLVQNGEEITGTFEAYASSGSIEPGTRKGNTIKFQFTPYYDMIVEGEIVSGCTILGRFDTIGYSGGNYDSDFVGYKIP